MRDESPKPKDYLRVRHIPGTLQATGQRIRNHIRSGFDAVADFTTQPTDQKPLTKNELFLVVFELVRTTAQNVSELERMLSVDSSLSNSNIKKYISNFRTFFNRLDQRKKTKNMLKENASQQQEATRDMWVNKELREIDEKINKAQANLTTMFQILLQHKKYDQRVTAEDLANLDEVLKLFFDYTHGYLELEQIVPSRT